MQSVMQIVHICIAVLNNSNHQCGEDRPGKYHYHMNFVKIVRFLEEKIQSIRDNDPTRPSETVSKLSKLRYVLNLLLIGP